MGDLETGRLPCRACGGTGSVTWFVCPLDVPGVAEAVTALEYVSLFWKGLSPVGGGVLDQSASFVEAARFVASEEARLKAEKKRPAT